MVAAAIGVTVASARLAAQTDYSGRMSTAMLSVGVTTGFGASGITDAPTGMKIPPIFAYRVGAAATYPLTPVIGATLDLGLDSRGWKERDIGDEHFYTITRLSYFTLTPGFRFSAFWVAFNVGFPMSGTATTKLGSNATEQSSDISDAALDQLAILMEPRIGAVVPLMDEEIGWLGLLISGGYGLTPLTDFTGDDRHLYSGHLGLTWQFGIPGTGRK